MKHTTLILILLLVACGSPPATGVSTPTPDAGATQAPPPLSKIAFTLDYGPQAVAPGEEGVVCLDVTGPDHDLWFNGIHGVTALMHHVNVWRRTTGTPYTTPTKCDGGGGLGVGIFGFTRADTTEFFDAAPEYAGAAMLLPKGTDIILDLHYLNASDTPGDATLKVDFFEAPSHELEVEAFSLNAAKSLVVPPGVTKTLEYSCPAPMDTKILETTAHVHAHDIGVGFSVNGAEVYRSTDWSSPVVREFDSLHGGDLSIRAGDTLAWSCEIANTTASNLVWANSVYGGEMCIVFGRSIGPKWGCVIP